MFIFLLVCLIIQYIIITIIYIVDSIDDSIVFFENKKTVLNNLIPFYYIVYIYNGIIIFINKLKNHYKELQ